VKVPYAPIPLKRPIPSLGRGLFHYRPLLAVRLTGPGTSQVYDGLLDTGADETVFDQHVAQLLGVDLRGAPDRLVGLAGRPSPVRCRYAPVHMRITDGVQETYEWTAVVGFVPGPLHYHLLGQAGFLQYFLAEFDGEVHQVTLTPKPSFPGQRI
jgi:hypothetical protein